MATYYISPSGKDTNTGTSSSSPWKTFDYATPQLIAGDTLILMDGTYSTLTGTGSCYINYNNRIANNGTPTNPITIKAQNERKALIKAEIIDQPDTLIMQNVSYWIIEGIRFEGKDFPLLTADNHMFMIDKCSNIILRRILGDKTNRYGNNHLLDISWSTNVLVEECELYHFHRHGLFCWHSSNITLRRNYANGRDYLELDPSTGLPADNAFQAQGQSFYYTNNSINENGISEHGLQGYNSGGDQPADNGDNNTILGCIALNMNDAGFKVRAQQNIVNYDVRNNKLINNIAVNCFVGFQLEDVKNALLDHVSIIGIKPPTTNPDGSINKSFGVLLGNPFTSVNEFDATVSNVNIVSSQGTYALDTGSFLVNWSFDHINVYGGIPVIDVIDSHITNLSQVNPNIGTCKAWIPSTSTLKGAGTNGSDIGANILYRYQDGVLTNTPLWNTTTGEFPHGVVITGVNDVVGDSLFDVHTRLNINNGGCPFPAGYGTITTGSISISSIPVGAEVFIDGTDQLIKTNVTINNIPTGSHTLRLSLTGYQDYTQSFNITTGTTTTLPSITLSQVTTGSLNVSSSPSGAEVFIDNINTTIKTNTTISNITTGSHTLKLTLTGYQDYTQSFSITSGQTTTLPTIILVPNPPPSSGMIAYWKFDEGNGITTADSVNGYAGLIYNITWTTGKFGYALSFDGTTSYVDFGTNLNLITPFTITMWIKANAISTYRGLITKGESTSDINHNYYISLTPSNNLSFSIGDGTNYQNFLSDLTIDTNWHHLAFVFGSSTDMRIYIDAISQSGVYTGTPISLTSNTKKTLIGASSLTDEFFSGLIDEVKIFNYAMTTVQVQSDYQSIQCPLLIVNLSII